jgi:acyl carrier protein
MSVTVSANRERVKKVLAEALNRAGEELDDEQALISLVAESFALIETVIRLQEELGIRLVQEDLRAVTSVGDLVGVCAERLD